MNHLQKAVFSAVLAAAMMGSVHAAEWHVAPDGKADAQGTTDVPWDLASALGGQQKVAPGDTLWIAGGTYKHPDRKLGSTGYVVRLAGEKDKPIRVRAVQGERATIDGGLSVQQPSTWLWIRDLEILVSENFSMSRRVEEPGSHPESYKRPWGGLHVHGGEGCKFINLVIHDNAQGISWWRGSTDSEIYGCLIYNNGWDAPDRGHGHAIYTQNENGTKTIADCIMTGGYGYTMHAYGSSRAYVDNYLIEGNICYDGGSFLIGGGRPSRNIRVFDNLLCGINLQVGYSAPHNENCEIRDNVILGGGLQINNYRKVLKEGNLVLGKNDPRPAAADARVEIRPNRYEKTRAHVAVFNWAKRPEVDLELGSFLDAGDRFRLMDPREFFGKPVVTGKFDGRAIRVPVDGEFTAFVLLKESSN